MDEPIEVSRHLNVHSPRITMEVAKKESMAEANLGSNSPRTLEKSLQAQVSSASMKKPTMTGTCRSAVQSSTPRPTCVAATSSIHSRFTHLRER